jgi:Glycosyl transferases group 1
MASSIKNFLRSARKSCGVENFYRCHIRPYLRRDRRVKVIMTPSSLGAAKRHLAPEIEQKIKEHLDRVFSIPMGSPPPGATFFKADTNFKQPAKTIQALVVMQRHINGDPSRVESDLAFHFTHSAKAAGIEVKQFDCDQCAYKVKDKTLAQSQLNELQDVIIKAHPDMVVFDGNFIGSPESINAEWWTALKKKCRFKLVTVIADYYPPHQDYLAYWTSTDLGVVFHSKSIYAQEFPYPERILFAPSLPFAEDKLGWAAAKNKDISFCCIGSDYRNRYEFCSQMKKTKLPVKIMLHHRFNHDALSIDDYINTICRSKVVFNTGFVNKETTIVTGRAIEAILCKALLLEDSGSGLSDFFIPWRHFIPVTNAHEVAIYTQFFTRNEAHRQQIAEEAFSMHQRYYSSKAFWETVLNKLALSRQ